MLLDKDNQRYPILISLHKSGSTWVNSFIHKRYRNIGLTTPPRNLYTEFFCKDKEADGENPNHIFVRKTDEERIALLEHLRTFGLELNQKVHVPEIIPVWPWFKEFYKDHDILVLKRRNIFSHWLSQLFFYCIRKGTNGVFEVTTEEGTTGLIPSKVKTEFDEEILKSTIQTYKIKFKFNETRFRQFVLDIRFLNDVVIKELHKPQVIWTEDITTEWLEDRFKVVLKKVPKPFTTFDYKIYFKPEDMKIIREIFEERFYNEFQYYGYELK